MHRFHYWFDNLAPSPRLLTFLLVIGLPLLIGGILKLLYPANEMMFDMGMIIFMCLMGLWRLRYQKVRRLTKIRVSRD